MTHDKALLVDILLSNSGFANLNSLVYEKMTREMLEEYVQGIYVYDDGEEEMEWKNSY